MRILLDSNVSPLLAEPLRALGHEVEWVGDSTEDPGDSTLLAAAKLGRRVIVTRDKDFGELAVRQGLPHCGISRLSRLHPRDEAAACIAVILDHGEELLDGLLVIVGQQRIRVRRTASH